MQSTGGVTGEGITDIIHCGVSPPDSIFSSIGFLATGTSGGSINNGHFGVASGTPPGLGIWSGSISGGTFDTTSYQLTGVQTQTPLGLCQASGGGFIPNVGDDVTITGDCGNNKPIQFSMSNNQILATFTGDVTCIVPIPTPPLDSACVGTGTGNTKITGTDADNTLVGTSGNNRMEGLACNDGMAGSTGIDVMHGDGGTTIFRAVLVMTNCLVMQV